MDTNTRVHKWGNSLGIRIQKSVADQIDLQEHTEVRITVRDNALIITPLPRKVTLESLLDGVTPENIHAEIDFGAPRGKEVW
jgi:antitoxin MazE